MGNDETSCWTPNIGGRDTEISKTAKDRRAGSLGYAEAMLIFYNKKMRAALPWNELYTSKNAKSYIKEGSGECVLADENADNEVS